MKKINKIDYPGLHFGRFGTLLGASGHSWVPLGCFLGASGAFLDVSSTPLGSLGRLLNNIRAPGKALGKEFGRISKGFRKDLRRVDGNKKRHRSVPLDRCLFLMQRTNERPTVAMSTQGPGDAIGSAGSIWIHEPKSLNPPSSSLPPPTQTITR